LTAFGQQARLDLLVTSYPSEAWVLLPEDQAELDLKQILERLLAAERRCESLLAELERARLVQTMLQRNAHDFRLTYAESRHRLQQMTVLYEVSTALGATVDPTEVLSRGAAGLERLLPDDRGAIYVLDDGGAVARRRALIGPGEMYGLPETVDLDRSPLGRCLASGLAVEGLDAGVGLSSGRVLVLPLKAGSNYLGAVLLIRHRPSPFSNEDRRLVEMVAGSTAMALQNARLANTDGLTGLYNRRYFDQALAFECERARRVGRPLGLLMVDIDNFKRFNDEHGHLGGDAVLRLVGSTLGRHLRRTDIAARVGGEEFGAILPESNYQAVLTAAERVRMAIEAMPPPRFEGHLLPTVRVSVGGATLTPGMVCPQALVGEADEALQRAKQAGRNLSVVVAIEGGNGASS
jgi:diguanylate cyclase (GGDEF)-like protein